MEIICIIILLIIAFVVFGLMGWGLKILGWVCDFLWEGCSTSIGCLFWVFIILFLIIGLIA
jgi:hypothetical protein